jgi:FKBP-type peptidyl-prolyl cis-trans isomerase SlyD
MEWNCRVCDHFAMNIAAPCVVSLVWRLEDTQGHLIDELKEPVEFFYGGDDLLEKVEEALADQSVGYSARLHLEPEHAFGEYDPNLVFFEARSIFPESVEPGMQFDGMPEGAATTGMPADAIYTVTEVYPSHVVLDGNHPLAGIALRLDLTVRDVRAATDDEIEAGSVGQTAFSVVGDAPDGSQLH